MDRIMSSVKLYHHNDGGRSLSRRPKQRNDCTVRALAIAEGRDYDLVYDELKDACRKCAAGFHFTEWANKQPERFEKISFPAIKGKPRMNVEMFCCLYSHGRYIARIAKHVMAVIDGVVYDIDGPLLEKCVYAAYRIRR